jgi:hypothetical protein
MSVAFLRHKLVIATVTSAVLAIGCSAAPTEPEPVAASPSASVRAPAIPGAPAVVTQAIAAGLSSDALTARGWECRIPPPTPDRVVCSHPNQGFPSPATPVDERKEIYTLLVFSTSGDYLGMQTVLRQDLYNGQVCESTNTTYVYRALIGYYECLRTVGTD